LEINNQIEKQKKVIKRPLPSIESLLNEVYGFMLKRIENEASAEDITIETFSKAFDKIASYNPEFQFNTWLISIAKMYISITQKKSLAFC
jgi:RNA polymerase sigma-70 factor (ECF subfamily)